MKNTLFKPTITAAIAMLLTCSCQDKSIVVQAPEMELSQAGLIPRPLEITENEQAFALYKDSYILVADSSEVMKNLGRVTAEKIFQKTGLLLEVNPKNPHKSATKIKILWEVPTLKSAMDEGNKNLNAYLKNPYKVSEAYTLSVGEQELVLQGVSAAGLFRGIQTLRQLIPEKATIGLAQDPLWVLAGGYISDAPYYAYRGAMLDVARHFFNKSEVKRFIDQLAYYKINTLHLHLTDDQGWRIAIEAWPKLTAVGGSKEVGGGPGGYYSKEQYIDLVAYAAKHFISIVPEVDMPGHTNAASVAYPFLNGNGKTPALYTGTEVGFSTWDANNEKVYDFVTDVVGEIAAMSPGPYFHLGGDESHVTEKVDYITFVDRVSEIVKQAGKTPIGWDEIVTAHTDETAVAQFWASEENAAIAVQKGMKVLLSPAKKAYLDMQYQEDSPYGLHWAGYVPVDTAYMWTPETYAKGVPKELILGIEAPLWSETVSNSDEIEFMAFPRLPGYAELAWTSPALRSWDHYKARLAKQSHFFDRYQINYYRSAKIDWETTVTKPKILGKD